MEDKEKKKNKNKGNIIKIISTVIVLILLCILLVWLCMGYYKKQTLNISNPIVTMEVEKFGTIKIELYPDKAPNTVKNFIKLANNGFYNGLKFHRVVKDFMIQGGDSAGDGKGSATLGDLNGTDDETKYAIKGEFNANGFPQNDLNLTEGTIAMARSDYTQYSSTLSKESYNSAGTQFFIMTSNDHTNLSGYYCGFGKVTEGLDVVKAISKVKVEAASSDDSSSNANTEKSKPVDDVKISSVSVDTFGVDYGSPETVEPFDYMSWLYSMYGMSK